MVETAQVLISLCCILSIAIWAWRFYLRVIVAKQYAVLELALFFALIMEIVMSAVQLKILELLRTASTPEDNVLVQKYFFSGTFFYLACLWNVKISINLLHMRLTEKFPIIHKWAVRSLYFLIITWPLTYVIFVLGCVPVSRRWEGVLGHVPSCPPIMREWDFWTHFALNTATDIWLCILPFSALLQIRERRLRFAVCGVYSLAFVVIIIGVTRAILLGINAQANIQYIIVLTTIELAANVVIGSLPGISSVFTRKYVYSKPGWSTQEWPSKLSRRQQPWVIGDNGETELGFSQSL